MGATTAAPLAIWVDGSYVCCNTRLNAGGKRGVRLSAVPTSLVGTSWGPVRLSVADTT